MVERKERTLLPRVFLCSLLVLSSCKASSSTLAQTQLAGLEGVNLKVKVSGDLPEGEARELERAIEKRLASALTSVGLSLAARDSEWFYLLVDSRYMEEPNRDGSVALWVAARLREPVVLNRNQSLKVPGGGGLTWWQDVLVVARYSAVREEVNRTVDFLVGTFLEEWQAENEGVKRDSKESSQRLGAGRSSS